MHGPRTTFIHAARAGRPARNCARTAHEIELEAEDLRKLLCEAEIIPMVFNSDGQVIDAGRSQRLFPRTIKRAARAQDGGCVVPGCTMDPALLDYRHIRSWKHGGKTSLSDCCPLCPAHHVAVHLGYLKIVSIAGLPHVILPEHLDTDRRPRHKQRTTRQALCHDG
ncbi:HNH endonuclease signature motif containing protein [Glutamicibacter arilaitensis]|uniref:HNH endonuclease signature motif containing protein n=1 Tax=Glutamicibacter arilaitensis TaxID=256701 RepID=UPI00384E7C5E